MADILNTHTFLPAAARAESVMCRPNAVVSGSWNGNGRALAERSLR